MSDGEARAARQAASTPDLCVIGAGARGIAIASAAAAFGVPVVLIERGEPGGSEAALVLKALVEAGARAQAIRDAERLGAGTDPAAPWCGERLHDHVQRVLSVPRANHSAERLAALGITLLRGEARFVSRSTVAVGDRRIKARRFVIATGSAPALPITLAGLDPATVLTEHGLAGMVRLPERLAVLGGGPRAVALGQALQRLGSSVAIVAPSGLLPQDDAEAVMLLRRRLLREGLELHEDADIARAEGDAKGVRLTVAAAGGERLIEAKSVLVPGDARQAQIGGLELDLAGIGSDDVGIVVDAGLRTANRRVYAVGSCAGGAAAVTDALAGEEHVGLVVKAVLLRQAGRIEPARTARTVWSRPGIATIGAPLAAADQAPGRLRVLRWPFAETPAAFAAGESEGFVKIVTDAKGRILNVTIAGDGAGEAIAPWCVALKAGLTVRQLAEVAFPGLSLSEASRRAALAFLLPSTRSPAIRRWIGLLRRLG